MSEEYSLLIQEYAKNPIQNFPLKSYTVKQHEGNFICGDDITVYLVIEKKEIKDYSFDGNCSTITKAAASFLAEFIKGKKIEDILTWTHKTMRDKGFQASPRRKRAVVIAIMAARNAIHNYLKDGKTDTFDDLIED
ncbi:MAG: iron-sulfur cluster assembly scaffold protein [Candidatus Absconditabacterales bacterium]